MSRAALAVEVLEQGTVARAAEPAEGLRPPGEGLHLVGTDRQTEAATRRAPCWSRSPKHCTGVLCPTRGSKPTMSKRACTSGLSTSAASPDEVEHGVAGAAGVHESDPIRCCRSVAGLRMTASEIFLPWGWS
jgi:hypothetical protein